MHLSTESLPGGVIKVVLDGLLDIKGTLAIDPQFNAIAEENTSMVVDLSAVTFIASIGIRTLLTGAKTIQARRGRFVLLNPQAEVEKVLKVSGVDVLMPIYADADAAVKAVTL